MSRRSRQADPKSAVIGLVLGLLIAVVALVASCVAHQQRMDLVETFTATASDGVVERIDVSRVRKNKKRVDRYTYHVSFSDSDGIRHECDSLATTDRVKIHEEGDHVEVRYDPMKADEQCLIVGDESRV